MKRSSVAGAVALFMGLPLAIGACALAASGCGLIIGLGDREPFPDGGKEGGGSSGGSSGSSGSSSGSDSGSSSASSSGTGSSSGSSNCGVGYYLCALVNPTQCCVVVETCTVSGCLPCVPEAGCLPCGVPGEGCSVPGDCCDFNCNTSMHTCN